MHVIFEYSIAQQKAPKKRKRADRETIPHITGWVYDIISDTATGEDGPKMMYKVCVRVHITVVVYNLINDHAQNDQHR